MANHVSSLAQSILSGRKGGTYTQACCYSSVDFVARGLSCRQLGSVGVAPSTAAAVASPGGEAGVKTLAVCWLVTSEEEASASRCCTTSWQPSLSGLQGQINDRDQRCVSNNRVSSSGSRVVCPATRARRKQFAVS